MLVGGEGLSSLSTSPYTLCCPTAELPGSQRAHGRVILKLPSNEGMVTQSCQCRACAPVQSLPCQVEQRHGSRVQAHGLVCVSECVEEKRGREDIYTHAADVTKNVNTEKWEFLNGKREEERGSERGKVTPRHLGTGLYKRQEIKRVGPLN